MASAALIPDFPTVRIGDRSLVDGGLLAKCPVHIPSTRPGAVANGSPASPPTYSRWRRRCRAGCYKAPNVRATWCSRARPPGHCSAGSSRRGITSPGRTFSTWRIRRWTRRGVEELRLQLRRPRAMPGRRVRGYGRSHRPMAGLRLRPTEPDCPWAST